MQKSRKKYEYHVKKKIVEYREFFVERLGREWDAIERGAHREELVRRARISGMVAGKALLVLLLLGGVVTVGAVAPNMFAAVGRIGGRKGFFRKKEFRAASHYLRNKGYIILKRHLDMYEMRITKTGADLILQRSLDDMRIPHQEVWDGIWRIVMFDIPDKHKWARDALRGRLAAMGFHLMQESVFVFPYPCEKEISFVIDLYSVSQYVRIASAKDMSHDTDLREYFGLITK